MTELTTTYVLVRVLHDTNKLPVKDIADVVSGRLWNMAGVEPESADKPSCIKTVVYPMSAKHKSVILKQGYNAEGKMVSHGARTSFDPQNDMFLMESFLEFSQGVVNRNLSLNHRLGEINLLSDDRYDALKRESYNAMALVADLLGMKPEEWGVHHSADSMFEALIEPRIKSLIALGKLAMSPDKPGNDPDANLVRGEVTFAQFQRGIADWMNMVFGSPVKGETDVPDEVRLGHDPQIRYWRFLEECIETAQAGGILKSDVLNLVDYTYGRPVGQVPQEIGGVLVTLAALCNAVNIKMAAAGMEELIRISDPAMMIKIRAKQATKPKFSSLPEAVLPSTKPAWTEDPVHVDVISYEGREPQPVPHAKRQINGD